MPICATIDNRERSCLGSVSGAYSADRCCKWVRTAITSGSSERTPGSPKRGPCSGKRSTDHVPLAPPHRRVADAGQQGPRQDGARSRRPRQRNDTLQTYTHLIEQTDRDVAERLERLLSRSPG